ncbi:uncharacterized protein LOC129571106 [Sitodiplosis mosellana]|uniref:uncharacterized protein LOC129571106 n=1 Tax=Sitodiplosis mosellana TaxID=263140 RepID=UPI002443F47C|nr:uncharacterized protein LOC129571106 [Sitodiplosis mosellana]
MTSAEFVGLMNLFPPPLEDVLKSEFELPLPFKGLEIPKDDQRILTKKIREFYFDGSADALKQYVDLLSDINFGYEIDKTVKTHAAKSNGRTFYAVFSMDSKLNVLKRQNPEVANVPGASHYDEVHYLFRFKSAQSLYDDVLSNMEDEGSKISLKLIDNITHLFTNFAKYGDLFDKNDSIQIRPVQGDNVHYLDLNNYGFTTGLNPKKETFDFLADIERQAISVNSLKQRDEL